MKLSIHLSGVYEDGHQCERTITADAPAPGVSIVEWWDNAVFPETGDGKPDVPSTWTARILDPAPDHLTGLTCEWAG